MKTKGIVLQSFGRYGYHFAAVNLAASIKSHNPDINITWFRSPAEVEYLRGDTPNFFDDIKDIDYENHKTPAWAKIDVLSRLPYDYNLILDVDALAMKDLEPMIDGFIKSKSHFLTSIQGVGKYGDDIPYDLWANHKDSYPFFGLKKTDKWITTQTSWMFAVKGKKAEGIHKELVAFYDKEFPIAKLKNNWGKHLPDELLFSGVLSRIKHTQSIAEPMFFGSKIMELSMLKDFYIMSLYGVGVGNTSTRLIYWDYYDREMRNIMQQHNYRHVYKGSYIQEHKIANHR